jgi:RimJ/RimL family protein N-acetyltransferase
VTARILETERLIVREFVDSDLDPLAAMLGDAETMRFYDKRFSRDDALHWLEKSRARYKANGFGLWVLEERETGTFLGDCGLSVQVVEGEPHVEIGWHVVRDRWRQGLATEAAQAIRDHGFSNLGLKRIIALIQDINVPSRGVAEKIGMTVEREVTWANLPHLMYSIGSPGGT